MKTHLLNAKALMIIGALALAGCRLNQSATGWTYDGEIESFEIPNYEPVDLTKYEYTKDLKFIEGKSFPCLSKEQTLTDYFTGDTVHIEAGQLGIYKCSSFLMSDHEVTNLEYREFVDWCRELVAADLLAKSYQEKRMQNGNYNEEIPIDWNDPILQKELYLFKDGKRFFNNRKILYDMNNHSIKGEELNFENSIEVYPDAECIEEELDAYRHVYWSDGRFDNYPVVGVNWLQANAYCLWRTDRLNEGVLLSNKVISKKSLYHTADALAKIHQDWLQSDSKKHAPLMFPGFSLPTEGEWIIATKPRNYESKTDRIFAWDGFVLTNEKGEFLANIKQDWFYSSDGYEFTAPVKSFRTEDLEIYDLCGNVSEWVLDSDSKDETLRLIKGGSWAGSLESLMIHKSELMPQTSSSSKVGFRVAMEIIYPSTEYITK
jgi:formylglycine-generating enzyme required for sulfatase activity